jgi:hypothetical protein
MKNEKWKTENEIYFPFIIFHFPFFIAYNLDHAELYLLTQRFVVLYQR